jgi:fructose-1-phosphate kinase PfkB-like protein
VEEPEGMDKRKIRKELKLEKQKIEWIVVSFYGRGVNFHQNGQVWMVGN